MLPVIAADGQTYERSAIIKHQQTHGTAPGTDEPLPAMFFPNKNIKKQFEAWKDEVSTS